MKITVNITVNVKKRNEWGERKERKCAENEKECLKIKWIWIDSSFLFNSVEYLKFFQERSLGRWIWKVFQAHILNLILYCSS